MRTTMALLALLVTPAPLPAAEWGDLTMRFAYDGAPPKPQPVALAVGAAAAGCGAGPVLQDRLLVNAKDKGVANICVWLLRTKDDNVPVHESYAPAAGGKVTMSNNACRFEPKILVMRTTQIFVGANADPTGHNMKAEFFNGGNASFNQNIPARGSMEKKLPGAETSPVAVNCNIHPWMVGYLLLRDDPYAAVSDASGKLMMKHVPAGEWTFVVWHESGYVTKPEQAGKPIDWTRGRVKIAIKPGENNLGEYLLSPAEFP